jgi:hypothetical protein
MLVRRADGRFVNRPFESLLVPVSDQDPNLVYCSTVQYAGATFERVLQVEHCDFWFVTLS